MYYTNLLNIKRSYKVLEIGPGGVPYWRSDVLADKYDNTDKVIPGTFGGQKHDTKGKPFYKIADNRLPFHDKEFDYIICSHVMEHIPEDELEEFCNEVFRVASLAYIEFPAPLYDIIFNFRAHLNLLFIQSSGVHCLPKKYADIDRYSSYFNKLFKDGLISSSNRYKQHFTSGKEFSSNNFELILYDNAEKFFTALSQNDYIPTKPGIIRKLYTKFRSLR